MSKKTFLIFKQSTTNIKLEFFCIAMYFIEWAFFLKFLNSLCINIYLSLAIKENI